jgi:hypothetical protein
MVPPKISTSTVCKTSVVLTVRLLMVREVQVDTRDAGAGLADDKSIGLVKAERGNGGIAWRAIRLFHGQAGAAATSRRLVEHPLLIPLQPRRVRLQKAVRIEVILEFDHPRRSLRTAARDRHIRDVGQCL